MMYAKYKRVLMYLRESKKNGRNSHTRKKTPEDRDFAGGWGGGGGDKTDGNLPPRTAGPYEWTVQPFPSRGRADTAEKLNHLGTVSGQKNKTHENNNLS